MTACTGLRAGILCAVSRSTECLLQEALLGALGALRGQDAPPLRLALDNFFTNRFLPDTAVSCK